MTPQQAIERVITLEGGYTIHRNQGESGDTYAGIYRTAHPDWQGWEYIDHNQIPPKEMVNDFYFSRFYRPLIGITNEDKRYVVFEYAVNTGLEDAIQTAKKVANVPTDGVLGKISTAAINAMDNKLETPPRAWGRHSTTNLRQGIRRNTPTGVGKTPSSADRS